MSELRELTDAELDIVGGGITSITHKPTEPPIVKLVEEIIVDILKILEPKQPVRAHLAQY
jgi:hypothetical protein